MSELLPNRSDKTNFPERSRPRAKIEPAKRPTLSQNKIATWRLMIAFFFAVAADIIFAIPSPLEGIEMAMDGVVGLILCFVLGFNWLVLPAVLLEAVPGLDVFPFWSLAVLSIAGIDLARRA